jgi:hypothetical protein
MKLFPFPLTLTAVVVVNPVPVEAETEAAVETLLPVLIVLPDRLPIEL